MRAGAFARLRAVERSVVDAPGPVEAAEAILAAETAWRQLGYERVEVMTDPVEVELELVVHEPGVAWAPATTAHPPRLIEAGSFARWAAEHPDGLALAGRPGRVLAPRRGPADLLRWDLPGVDAGLVVVRCEVREHGTGLLLVDVHPVAAW